MGLGRGVDGKYGGPPGVNEINYGEKTSEYGHYELSDFGHAGYNKDGSKWKSQNMEWVEDNRKFEAPAAEQAPKAEPEGPPPEVKLSDRAVQANKGVAAYEQILDRQGDKLFEAAVSPSKEQAFKDQYTINLADTFKAKDPVTLASKKAEIELADKYKLDLITSQ